jgi:MFS family permease
MKSKQPTLFYGYTVVATAFSIMFVMFGAYYSFGVFFKPLLAEFGWTRAMTSGAFSLSFILTGLFGVLAGKLTDKFGPRLVATACSLFLGLGYMLVSQTGAVWQFYLYYGVIVAIGMSSAVVPLQSTVARWFVKRRGTMTGIIVAGIGVGMLVMPVVANSIISAYGWRNSYLIVGITVLVLVIIAAQFLKRDPGKIGQLPYGGNDLTEEEDSMYPESSLRAALRTWQFWILTVALLCFTMAEGTVMVHIVPHAIDIGLSPINATLTLTLIGGVSIPGRIIMGSASDRIGSKRAWLICLALLSASLFWLLVARDLWMLYLFAVIFGFGYGGLSVLISPIVAEHFGLSSHGVIMGVVIMIGGTAGMAIGPVVAGHVFDITSSYQTAFWIYSVISVVGLVLMFLLKPAGSPRKT